MPFESRCHLSLCVTFAIIVHCYTYALLQNKPPSNCGVNKNSYDDEDDEDDSFSRSGAKAKSFLAHMAGTWLKDKGSWDSSKRNYQKLHDLF